ncbi:6-phosphogluconolactonase [bacterium]|nr:MAG: 6-phosphogluconolactonase [bacterium]
MPTKNPEIIILETPEEVFIEAANIFIETASLAITQRGVFIVALSGGNTPLGLYKLFAERPYCGNINWQKTHLFWSDERCVGPSDAQSNFRLANESFIKKVQLPEKNIHRVKGESCPASADEYEAEIKAFFKLGEDEFPAFDLTLLGMGTDGHFASIFPSSPAFKSEKIAVEAPAPNINSSRVTLTPSAINNSKNIIFLVTGPDKALALKQCLEGELKPEKYPAQITRLSKGRVLWLVDKAAASMITKR